MKAACLAFDNLDDRGEMLRLLTRLSPGKRLAFLRWCCRKSAVPNSKISPGPGKDMLARVGLAKHDDSADEKLSLEVFLDVWNLAFQYGLDLTAATRELERRVRKQ